MYVYSVVVKVTEGTEIQRIIEAERYVRQLDPEAWFINATSEPTQMTAILRSEISLRDKLVRWLRRLPDSPPFAPGSLLFFGER